LFTPSPAAVKYPVVRSTEAVIAVALGFARAVYRAAPARGLLNLETAVDARPDAVFSTLARGYVDLGHSPDG
jgi:hypothetical protein